MMPMNSTETSNIPVAQASPVTEAQPYQHPPSFFANTKPIFPVKTKRKAPAQDSVASQKKLTLATAENHPAIPPQFGNAVVAADVNQQEIPLLPYPESESSTTLDSKGPEAQIPTFDFGQRSEPPSIPSLFLSGDLNTEPPPKPTPPPLTLYEVIKAPEKKIQPHFHNGEPQARPWNLRAFQEIIQVWDWRNTTRYQAPEVLHFAEIRLNEATPGSWVGIENMRANIITAAVMLRMAKITWKCGYKGFNVNERGGYKVYDVKMGKVWPLPDWMPRQHIEILEGKSWDFISPKQRVIMEALKEKPLIRSVEAVWGDWRGETELK